MLSEKLILTANTRNILPCANSHRTRIKIINLCAPGGKHNRGMSRNYKLTAEIPCAVLNKLKLLNLFFRRKAVFGFIKQIQRIFLNFVLEIHECAFPV